MDTRTLRLLEYDKIREMLRSYAASSLGKELIDRMRPARDEAIVRARLEETTEARNILAEEGHVPLGGLRDVHDEANRAKKQGTLTAQELLDVAETAAACRRLRRYLVRATGKYPKLMAQGRLISEFQQVEEAIDRAISSQGEVLDSASSDLELARRRVRGLNGDIQRELQRVISSQASQELLQEPIITQRNGRFCVPVRAEARNTFKGIVHDLSASGQTVFMEPLVLVELGNDLREAERQEEEEVQRVLAALSGIVGRVADALLASLEAATRLDIIFARALFARALDATAPELNAEGIIDLRQGRHPLLGATAVPIDITLGLDGTSTLLITGPNTGGKTVTLKTVGLFTAMAQSGLHVPAEAGTRLALFNQIFADIGDEQSIEQSLSTFSSHMTNIVRIIKEAEANALVLLDEIGAGTDPAEGAALAKAILMELHERGCRTIATTHYGELKIFGQNTEGFLNASVEFDLQTLRPTYRIIAGLPGSSNALSISERLGLPKSLTARAKELMGEAPQAMEQVLKQAEGVRRALDRERTASTKARREAEETATRLKKELAELEEKRQTAVAKARQQAQEIVHKARVEANALLDELRTAVRETREQAARSAPPADTARLREKTRAVISNLHDAVETNLPSAPVIPAEVTPPTLTSVSAGQTVYVRSVGHRGTVLEGGSGKDDIEVQVGIMRVRVPLSDLELRAPTDDHAWALVNPAPAEPVHQVDGEIHLLGMRAEEAASKLEEYLFDALDCGITKVRIVHGFGTGTLRNVVQQLLRRHPAVRKYRQGESHEGGGGVTIAEVGLRA